MHLNFNTTPAKYATGSTVGAQCDSVGRLRTTSESARDGVAISYGSGDQTLANESHAGIYVSTAGTLVVRMADATADLTFSGLLAGVVYPICAIIIRQSGSTAAGIALL